MKFNQEVNTILSASESKKAFDIKVIDIRGLSSIADYYIIMSANSERQVSAIGNEIEMKMTEAGIEPINTEGYKSGRWVILDYGDTIVHIFKQSEREFYNLEKLWLDASSYDID
ncbi:MAG: ribosome silencing factor [Andreesenia angusta]|nr:ribosome silencing factor [Andreesenia angusta]